MKPYYADDLVTLYHGDCRDFDLAALAADVLVTDPPYGVSWDTRGSRGKYAVRTSLGMDLPAIVGDDVPFDPEFLLRLGIPTALFGAQHYSDRLPASPAWVVWDKRVGMNSNDQSDCDMVWTNVGGRARMIRYQFNGGLALAKENGIRPGSGRPVGLHPTQKPVAVMRQLIEWMPPGLVLDPFMGSGSTIVAAKSLGRRSIGIELHEPYCESAARRCSQEVLGLGA